MNKVELKGCAPSPLIMNLKALGIFRILSEQKESEIKANWENDALVLHTNINKDEIVNFFLEKYVPTPIISPWNGRSGFYDKEGGGIENVKNTKHERSRKYCDVFKDAKNIIEEHVPEYTEFLKQREGFTKKEFSTNVKELKDIVKSNKTLLLKQFRNKLSDDLLPWLDAVYVIASNKPSFETVLETSVKQSSDNKKKKSNESSFGTILGTGGNDGSFEISSNFMEFVTMCVLIDDDKEIERSKKWIQGSLFDEECIELVRNSSGYFYPGGYMGPTSTSSAYDKYSFINPWDYILMIEGTMLFAGSISRRSNSKKAAFPFTVESSMAGYGTSSDEKSRGELWIPLWDNPATFDEIKYVFNEGRVQIGTRNANTGVDIARALASLGIERGLSGFQRFGLLERKGDAYLASSIARMNVVENTKVNLFIDIDSWLTDIRQKTNSKKNPPKSISSLLRSIDNAIISFCTYGKETDLQNVMIILGKIELAISRSTSLKKEINPLQYISSEWINAAYDGTPEFRLAVALASITTDKKDKKDRPIRCNLEPIEKKVNKVVWSQNSPHSVLNIGNLVQNMTTILERRCLDSQIQKSTSLLLKSSKYAPIKDVLLFLEDKINTTKINNLLLPLSIIDYTNYITTCWDNDREVWEMTPIMPESYITMKSNFLPVSEINSFKNVYESSIIRLLKSENLSTAERIMQRRLYINRLNVLTYQHTVSTTIQEISKNAIKRLAASLLFPIRDSDIKKLISSITKDSVDKNALVYKFTYNNRSRYAGKT